MRINVYSSRYSLELLPSILIQQCLGKVFVYMSWLTVTIEFGPEE